MQYRRAQRIMIGALSGDVGVALRSLQKNKDWHMPQKYWHLFLFDIGIRSKTVLPMVR